MSIKGYPSQKKLTTTLSGFSEEQSQTKNEFVTAQPTFSDRNALDTVALSAYRIHGSAKTATPDTNYPKRIITSTAHGAKAKDIVRFEANATNPGFESSILSVPDDNTIVLGSETPLNILGTDQFFILRYATTRVDDSGAPVVSTTSGPVQFKYNSVTTEVSQDTGTPSNSRPLPVVNLNTSGVAVDPATSALQQAEAVLIGAVNETAPASDTASSGLNGRLQRIAQRITSLIALFPASIGQKNKAGSLAVTLASDEDLLSRLPATLGQKADAASLAVTISNEGTAQIGSLTETAPATDTASSGLNGRLQRIAQRLTSLIGLLPSSLGTKAMSGSLSVTVANDQTSIPVTVGASSNIIGNVRIDQTTPGTTNGVQVNAAIPAGSNVIGKVSIDQTTPGTTNLVALAANQSVNNTQIAGNSISTGNGVSGTGTQRVTIASDSTFSPKLAGKAQANTPIRNDYSSVNVTTSAYVTLVASLTSACTEVEIFDSSGQTLYLATGAAASEVNQILIFPGGNGRVPLAIAAGTRVSIKAVSATASVGEIDINFYA